MKNYFLIIGSIVLLCIGCGKSYMIDEEVAFETKQWAQDETLDFIISVTDTSKRYNIYLEIDHSKMYIYQNIYMNVHTKYPSGKSLKQQLNVDLAELDGKWKGICKGEDCKAQIVLQENAYFNELGTHTFGFEQFTRDIKLSGMNGISFKVEEH